VTEVLIRLNTIEADQFILHYVVEGNGLPAIVVGSAIYYPRTFSKHLRQHLQLIFMDHRGFGKATSLFDNTSFELDLLVDDIEKLKQTLGLDKVIIIGHSGHAYMALQYAKKYPDSVSQVVLIAVSPDQSTLSHQAADSYFQDSVCDERKAWLEADLRRLPDELAKAPGQAFITFCKRLGAKSWYDYQFDASPLWEGVSVNQEMFDYVWGKLFAEIDITRRLHDFAKPVFLALGKFDYLVAPFYVWNLIRDQFKDLTIRLFEKSSHTPQLEEPELFDHELLHWLSLLEEKIK
jgi:proline iminopeptidase